MPRFTKPVVEDENGELIIPGAYGAAPGGIIERRSTFEWDNEDRAAPAPLIDTDELSVAFSDDDDDDAEPSSTRRNSTRTARTVATQGTGATTETAASEDDKDDDDEETGQSSSSSQQQPSDDADGEDEGPPEHALPTEEVLTAHVVAAPPPPKSSVWARAFGCSKQASTKESRIRMAVFIGLAMTLGMIVLLTRRKRNNNLLFRGNKSEDGSVGLYDPPSATLAKRADLGIQDVIAEVVVNATMLEPDWNSPYYEALYWILYEDTLQLTPPDATLQQRYLLATFYFATSSTFAPSKERRDRRSIWKQCAAPEQPPMTAGQVDVNATKPELQCTHHVLTAEKPSQVYTTVPNSWRWLSPVSECEWAGVMCNDEGFVISIELANYGLTGTLLEELTFLPYLEKLSLPYNDFLHGGIPSSFLTKLSTLELQYNQHDGMLELLNQGGPMELLNLAGNQLTGSIPADLFTQLTTLRQVSFQENSLTGLLPSTTSTGLQVLRLNDNQLSGSIPTTLVASPADTFRVLDLSQNEAMTGTIPSELGLATKLQTLALARAQFTGTLPLELYALTKLQIMDIQDNQFSGTMATEIGRLTKLRQVYWQDNAFSGTLPTHLGRLTRIEELEIQGNNFTGVIPQGFCNMFDDGLPMALSVEVVADCGSDMPTIMCPDGCCSQCCHLGECTLDNFAVLGLNATGDKPVMSTTSKSESP